MDTIAPLNTGLTTLFFVLFILLQHDNLEKKSSKNRNYFCQIRNTNNLELHCSSFLGA